MIGPESVHDNEPEGPQSLPFCPAPLVNLTRANLKNS